MKRYEKRESYYSELDGEDGGRKSDYNFRFLYQFMSLFRSYHEAKDYRAYLLNTKSADLVRFLFVHERVFLNYHFAKTQGKIKPGGIKF